MKVRPFTCLLLLIFLAPCFSCTQQPKGKANSDRKPRGKTASAAKQPIKVNYLAGEIVSINMKKSNLLIRGKDGDFEVFVDKKTIVKSDNDNIKLSDLSSGNKVTVRYISLEGRNIAKSIFIAYEKREEQVIQKQGNAPAEPQSVSPPDQPPIPPEKKWPSS